MLKQSCQLKSFLFWKGQRVDNRLQVLKIEQKYRNKGAKLKVFCFVEENKLTTASGDVITYDHLVIAMGLQLRFLPFTLLSKTKIYCLGMRRSKVCQKLSTPRVLALTIGKSHYLTKKVHPLIFQCEVCGKDTSSDQGLQRRKRALHLSQQPDQMCWWESKTLLVWPCACQEHLRRSCTSLRRRSRRLESRPTSSITLLSQVPGRIYILISFWLLCSSISTWRFCIL